MIHFWQVFENLKFEVKQCYQQKLVENAKIEKLKRDILDYFEHCDSVGNFFFKNLEVLFEFSRLKLKIGFASFLTQHCKNSFEFQQKISKL